MGKNAGAANMGCAIPGPSGDHAATLIRATAMPWKNPAEARAKWAASMAARRERMAKRAAERLVARIVGTDDRPMVHAWLEARGHDLPAAAPSKRRQLVYRALRALEIRPAGR